MPVDCGSITASRALAATAPSAAVPPARITSIAASAACGCEVATIAFWAWTVERPAKWKFLIKWLTLLLFYENAGGALRRLTWHIPEGRCNGLRTRHP